MFTVDGNYPQRVLDTIPESILRRFTDAEKKIIQGSADFYAIGTTYLCCRLTPRLIICAQMRTQQT